MIHAVRVFNRPFGQDDVGPVLQPPQQLTLRFETFITDPAPADTPADFVCRLRAQGFTDQQIADEARRLFPNATNQQILDGFAAANLVCPPVVPNGGFVDEPSSGGGVVIEPVAPGRGGALKPFLIVGGILVGIVGVALIVAKTGKKSPVV